MSSPSGHEADAAAAALNRRVGLSAPLASRPFERHALADCAPGSGIALGGVRLWHRRAATAERHGCCVGTAQGIRLLLVAPDSEASPHVPGLRNVWTLGLTAPWIARWFGLAPEAIARRLEADDAWVAPLSTYLRRWAWEDLEALQSSFERELVGEYLLGLLAMAVASASDGPAGTPDAALRSLHCQGRARPFDTR